MVETGYSRIKFTELTDKNKIPRIGYGTAKNEEASIKEAINIGYRHIDTASMYGTEEAVGKVLKEALSNGTVKREDLFITTKITSAEKNDVEQALKQSLEKMQLDYVDLYLIHWPVGEVDHATGKIKKQIPLHVTWKAMEDQVRAGRAKSIGVSNFSVQILLDLLSYAEIKPVCNQVEVHPYFTQEDLVGFCKKNDIEVVAYCPLAKTVVKTLMEEPVIQELAVKYNKAPGQIVLNWHLSRGYTVIPKSTNAARIKENFGSDTFELSLEDIQKITALNKDTRLVNPKNQSIQGHIPLFA